MAKRTNGFRTVLEQRALEGGIGPGLGYDNLAVMRPDLRLERLDDGVERRRIDVAFLGQNSLERAHAQLHLGQLGAVIVVMIVVAMNCHVVVPWKLQVSFE